MKAPEFEEREYEGPLYNQLERGSPILWPPGQVLEARVGFDRSLWLGTNLLWQLHGHSRPLSGVVLSNIVWPQGWGPPDPQKKLPNFSLNLFVQAKRSYWTNRRPAIAKKLGPSGPTWSFAIDSEQQQRLDVLAQHTQGHALIVYAAPVFHTQQDLWRHTVKADVVQSSTFPSATSVTGHTRWYFDSPGAHGVANPEPTVIDDGALDARLLRRGAFRSARNEDHDPETELAELGGGLLFALRSEVRAPTSRDARFFNGLATLDAGIERFQISPMVAWFLRIAHLAETYNLLWLAVG